MPQANTAFTRMPGETTLGVGLSVTIAVAEKSYVNRTNGNVAYCANVGLRTRLRAFCEQDPLAVLRAFHVISRRDCLSCVNPPVIVELYI